MLSSVHLIYIYSILHDFSILTYVPKESQLTFTSNIKYDRVSYFSSPYIQNHETIFFSCLYSKSKEVLLYLHNGNLFEYFIHIQKIM